mmetsp:Transcript_2359/g.4788  ORF Transcript_2359/g.4788 Transcript_2359/m.4788 type:complete len:235 (-) Transcript_2359:287-991(-)
MSVRAVPARSPVSGSSGCLALDCHVGFSSSSYRTPCISASCLACSRLSLALGVAWTCAVTHHNPSTVRPFALACRSALICLRARCPRHRRCTSITALARRTRSTAAYRRHARWMRITQNKMASGTYKSYADPLAALTAAARSSSLADVGRTMMAPSCGVRVPEYASCAVSTSSLAAVKELEEKAVTRRDRPAPGRAGLRLPRAAVGAAPHASAPGVVGVEEPEPGRLPARRGRA